MELALKRLVQFAFSWRIFLTIFQASVNYVFEDFDSSGDIFVVRNVVNHTGSSTEIDMRSGAANLLNLIFNGLNKWDSIYFMHIAETGYDYEQMMAFFPAFPFLITNVARLFTHEVLMIKAMSYLFNLTYFILAVYFLYQLTSMLSRKNAKFTQVTTLLFILNPATIFMMSSYTEAQFVFLQFSMMFCLETGRFRTATVLIACSMLTRSNGLLNIAFLGYFFLKSILLKHYTEKETIKTTLVLLIIKRAKCQLFELVLSVLLSIAPFVFYQYHSYNLYCTRLGERVDKDHWCHWKIPLSYSYIQSFYWNVGFLRYYELKQIPNFILAFPAIYVIFAAARDWCHLAGKDIVLKALGLFRNSNKKKESNSNKSFIEPGHVMVYLLHALFLTLSGLVAFHVQILTRMICSSTPIFYWTCANFCLDGANSNRKWSFVSVYFLVYLFIGIVLHTNFYPWT